MSANRPVVPNLLSQSFFWAEGQVLEFPLDRHRTYFALEYADFRQFYVSIGPEVNTDTDQWILLSGATAQLEQGIYGPIRVVAKDGLAGDIRVLSNLVEEGTSVTIPGLGSGNTRPEEPVEPDPEPEPEPDPVPPNLLSHYFDWEAGTDVLEFPVDTNRNSFAAQFEGDKAMLIWVGPNPNLDLDTWTTIEKDRGINFLNGVLGPIWFAEATNKGGDLRVISAIVETPTTHELPGIVFRHKSQGKGKNP